MQRINRINRPFLLAPTADQFDAYNLSCELAHGTSGNQYRTGPRYAQQFADRTESGRIGVAKYKAEQANITAARAK